MIKGYAVIHCCHTCEKDFITITPVDHHSNDGVDALHTKLYDLADHMDLDGALAWNEDGALLCKDCWLPYEESADEDKRQPLPAHLKVYTPDHGTVRLEDAFTETTLEDWHDDLLEMEMVSLCE